MPQKDLVILKVAPIWWEIGGNCEFYATLRFAYLRVVKRLKMVQKINWLMGLEINLILEIEIRTCSDNRCPSSMAESFKQKNS